MTLRDYIWIAGVFTGTMLGLFILAYGWFTTCGVI